MIPFGVVRLIMSLVDLYTFLIFAHVLLSWVPSKRGVLADIDYVLGRLCDPYLNLFKRIIPPMGMVDLSPIVALLVLQFAVRLILILA